MIIARETRKTNIAEYILYMWQVEDLLRACAFDPEKIKSQLVSRFNADEETSKEITVWYNNLAAMMEKEHVTEKGHVQVLVNLVNDLNEFHLRMLEVEKDMEYVRLYQANGEAISDFTHKSADKAQNEVEACLNALYGYMVLKLKNAEVSQLTMETIRGFGQLIGHLSARYIQFENDDFEF
jgi:hypothetical protein